MSRKTCIKCGCKRDAGVMINVGNTWLGDHWMCDQKLYQFGQVKLGNTKTGCMEVKSGVLAMLKSKKEEIELLLSQVD